jgi:O-antigen/teichoic acid export membrane protein
MTALPEAGIAGEVETGPPVQLTPARGSLWTRARSLMSERFSYALGDQVVFSVGNVAIAALVSRFCAPREFGIYILTQRALDIVNQLSNVLLWAPFMFNMPSMGQPRRRVYLGSIVLQQIVVCVLAMFALRGAAWWASTPARSLYYGVFAPLVLTSFGIVFREFTRRMYFAEMRLKEAFWTDVATNGLQILGVVWLWRMHRLDVAGALWSLADGAILVSFWWLIREWRTWTVQLRTALDDFRLNVKLGKWFLGSNMVFMVSSQCNPWLLGALLGPVSVGAYSICEQVVNIPRVALVSIQNILAPMMARAHAEGGRPALRRMVRRQTAPSRQTG